MVKTHRNIIRSAIESFNRLLGMLAAVITVAMMLIIVINVVLRAAKVTPIQGTAELATVLFVTAAFLGMGYTQYIGGHISTSLVTSRLKVRTAGIVNVVGLVCVIVFLGFAIWATAERAMLSFRSGEMLSGGAQVDLWPIRWAIVIGLVGLLMQLLLDLLDRIKEVRFSVVKNPDHVAMPGERAV